MNFKSNWRDACKAYHFILVVWFPLPLFLLAFSGIIKRSGKVHLKKIELKYQDPPDTNHYFKMHKVPRKFKSMHNAALI